MTCARHALARCGFAVLAVALAYFALPEPSYAADQADAALRAALSEQVRRACASAAEHIVRIDTIGGAQPVALEGAQAGPRGAEFRVADGPTTGVVWSEDGLIVTSSFNFVRDPTVITVTLADGGKHVARLIARDAIARLALLKIDAGGLKPPRWAGLPDVRPGQWAMAAGFGHGSATPAISLGVVSATRRMNDLALQTDARISPANYGGPLFDLDARFLGVCVPLGPGESEVTDVQWYDSGIAFAVRADVLAERVARMAEGRTLRRGVLGVTLDLRDPVVEDAAAPALDAQPPGVAIVADPVGPALDAGLQSGDRITRVAGAPTETPLAFRRAMARHAAGDEIELTISRAGESQTVRLTLVAPEELTGVPASQPG